MSASLTFTSAPFGQTTSFASGASASTTILTADPTYARRLYGLTVTNSATQTPTATISIKDGSAVVAAAFIVTLTTGINVITDIFQNSAASGLFQKQKDANGVPYFNIPATWTMTCQLSANSTNNIYTYAFGETYA